jgi:hypothetical protein
MKIKLKIAGREITAMLVDSEASRDFVSLLPLTLTMNDLFGREKFGHLPRAISEGGKRARTYEIGDVVYCHPGRMWRSSIAMTGSQFRRRASSSSAKSNPARKR